MNILKIIAGKISQLFSKKGKEEEKSSKSKVCSCGRYVPVSRIGRFADSSCVNCGGSQPYPSQSYYESTTFNDGWTGE